MAAEEEDVLFYPMSRPDWLSRGAFCSLAGLVVTVLALNEGAPEIAGLFGVPLLVLGGVFFLVMKKRANVRFVGLRLDNHGVSGYLLRRPLAWADIEDVILFRNDATEWVRLKLKPRNIEDVGQQSGWQVGNRAWLFQTNILDIDATGLGISNARLARVLREWGERHNAGFITQK